jgi:hypothetical protein
MSVISRIAVAFPKKMAWAKSAEAAKVLPHTSNTSHLPLPVLLLSVF